MSLYQKHRPAELSAMAGNKDTIASLESMLASPSKPHALLFTGPSGTGKTTAARIVAKVHLGCSDMDYREVDSADFRGVDTIREMRQNARLKPMGGPVRVWLLDECHQLTKDAQNALLKALEDPPAHAYFLLATTDPEKLLPTIKTRCVEFRFSPLPQRAMMRLLREVAEAEGAELPVEVAERIALDSMGSARQALVVLEKVLGMEPGQQLRAAELQAAKENQVIDLCRKLMDTRAKWPDIAAVLQGLKGEDPEKVRRAVLGYCSSVLLNGKAATADPRTTLILLSFRDTNTFDCGWPGLVGTCAELMQNLA